MSTLTFFVVKQGNGAFFGPKKRRKGQKSRETALFFRLTHAFLGKKHGKGDQGISLGNEYFGPFKGYTFCSGNVGGFLPPRVEVATGAL